MRRSGEAQLVALARGLFGGDSFAEVQLLLFESWPAPAKLSPEGLDVLEDTLGKGAVLWLARHGAWRDRLWTKMKPPPMRFDHQTVPVLQWLLEQPLGHELSSPIRVAQHGPLGSELLLLATLAAVIDSPAERAIASQAAVRSSPLCRLAFPLPLLLAAPAEASVPPPLAFDEAQDFALAALQPSLAKWWRAQSRLLARLLLPSDVLRCGQAQARVLDQLLAWAEASDRRERCTFLLEAFAPLLHPRASAAEFVAVFDDRMSLRERAAARRAAAAALHGVGRLHAWDEHARTVRFIDDGYDAAQARVRNYEDVFGHARFQLAQKIRDELDALPQ